MTLYIRRSSTGKCKSPGKRKSSTKPPHLTWHDVTRVVAPQPYLSLPLKVRAALLEYEARQAALAAAKKAMELQQAAAANAPKRQWVRRVEESVIDCGKYEVTRMQWCDGK